jgi:hypothetical protein
MLCEPEKLVMRKRIVDHPFGTMKHDINQGYLLLKGLRKVVGKAEFTMLASQQPCAQKTFKPDSS